MTNLKHMYRHILPADKTQTAPAGLLVVKVVGLKLLKNAFLKELCQLQHLFRRWMTTARAWMPLFLVLSATTTI